MKLNLRTTDSRNYFSHQIRLQKLSQCKAKSLIPANNLNRITLLLYCYALVLYQFEA